MSSLVKKNVRPESMPRIQSIMHAMRLGCGVLALSTGGAAGHSPCLQAKVPRARARDRNTVRTDRNRYTAWTDKSGTRIRGELYDLEKDPAESINRADDTEYRTQVAEHEALRTSGWKAVRDRILQ